MPSESPRGGENKTINEKNLQESGLFRILVYYLSDNPNEVLQGGKYSFKLSRNGGVSYSTDNRRWLILEGVLDPKLLRVTLSPSQISVLEQYRLGQEMRHGEMSRGRIAFFEGQGIKYLTLFVPDAVNPYCEALAANNIETPEKENTVVNLSEILQQDADKYRSLGLETWAQDIESKKDKLTKLSPEKLTIIEQEVKDGAIPIFMPGRETQKQTTMEELADKLKPIWKIAGKNFSIGSADVWDYITALTDELVAGLPVGPYINLTKPMRAPNSRTCSQTLEQQINFLEDIINVEREKDNKQKANAMLPYEYAALQTIFTARLEKKGKNNLSNISPLDRSGYTRFISLPPSPNGYGSQGHFSPGSAGYYGHLDFGWCDATVASSYYGFRLSVRVEI